MLLSEGPPSKSRQVAAPRAFVLVPSGVRRLKGLELFIPVPSRRCVVGVDSSASAYLAMHARC